MVWCCWTREADSKDCDWLKGCHVNVLVGGKCRAWILHDGYHADFSVPAMTIKGLTNLAVRDNFKQPPTCLVEKLENRLETLETILAKTPSMVPS